MSQQLVRYSAMLHAIAVCHSVDEVKDLKDKARALELYAQQSKNTDAERKACDIRMRAERRTGELLKDLARATPQTAKKIAAELQDIVSNGGTRSAPTPYADALQRTGMSRQTASRYEALAAVPAEMFEAAMAGADKPTTRGVLDAIREAPKMPADALWLWGRMRDMEREGYFSKSPESLLSPLTETMLADMQRILPLCAEFINQLSEAVHESA